MSSSNDSERRPRAGQAAATDSGTGSQAEPAATVARASDGRIIDGAAKPGDSVVESDADGTETVARQEDHRAGSTQRVGRFDVSSILGSGAFGDVYLARDPQLQREVALKVPRKGSFRAGEEAERFLREARSAAALQHPNICPVFEVFEEDDHFVIVMGYIRGRRLDQYFEPGKPLPGMQAARVVARLAKALQYAHDKGIVHRDLKPANIIVDADRKEPVIMDFGLARREDSGDAALTRSGDILGSPAYMSPEQARGRVTEIGPHSDIYSLGVILYELLCGERPFGGSVAQVIGCIIHVETPAPSTRHAGIDTELEAICLKAMSKEKSDRYASMREFAAALSQWVKRQRGSTDDAGAVSQAGDIVESRERAPGSAAAGSGTPGVVPDAAEARDAAVADGDADAGVSISPFETVPSADVSAITATVAREDAAKVAREEAAVDIVVSEHEASGRVGARRRTGRGGVFSGRRGLLIGLAGAAVLLAAIVFSIRTPKGTVQFTLTDPTADITITVDGDNIDVKTLDQALHLEVGDHEMKATAPGFETLTRNFTVRKGSNPTLEIALLPANKAAPSDAAAPDKAGQLPRRDRLSAAVPLFNGVDLAGWQQDSQSRNWRVQDGVLSTTTGFGALATEAQFSDFELQLEFRLQPGANSGVFLRMNSFNVEKASVCVEVQILDDTYPEHQKAAYKSGAVYGFVSAAPPAAVRPNQWHQMGIRLVGSKLRVEVNGVATADLDLTHYAAKLATLKQYDMQRGFIGLQRYDSEVEFRNITVRDLSPPAQLQSSATDGEAALSAQAQIPCEFVGARAVAELNDSRPANAYGEISADGLDVFWTREDWESLDSEIFTATRRRVGDVFSTPVKVMPGRHPSVSADRRTLISLQRNGSDEWDLVESTRADLNSAFSPRRVLVAAVRRPKSPSLSSDGLRLVFQQAGSTPGSTPGSTEFLVSSRDSVQSDWSAPSRLTINLPLQMTEALTWPMLSQDQLTLLVGYGGDRDARVLRLTRPTIDAAFERFDEVTVDGSPLMARAPRYVPETRELIYTVAVPGTPHAWKLWIAKGELPSPVNAIPVPETGAASATDPATDAESESALAALAARVGPLKGKLAADAEVATLRKELWDFRLKHFGSPLALRAAEVASELRWPTDELRREDVDPYELTVTGLGDAANAPAGIVQIVGDSRLRHSSATYGVAFSPDGSRLASSGNDRRILIWDTATGREVARWRAAGAQEREMVFSPDGRTLFSASGYGESKDPEDRHIHVWNVQTGELIDTLTGHEKSVRRLAITGDDRYLLSAGYDLKLRVWDLADRTIVRTIDCGGAELGASPVGTLFATGQGGLDHVTLWDAATGETVRKIEGIRADIALSFNRDGTRLACVSTKELQVSVCDVSSGALRFELSKPHGTYAPRNAVFLDDSKQLVTCGDDGQINVWDAVTGEKVALEQTVVSGGSDHWRNFNDLAVSRDGRLMSTARWDCSVRLFELPSFRLLHTSPDFADSFQHTAASDDGLRIATSSYDRRTAAWDIGPEPARRHVHTSWIQTRGIAVSASGRVLGAVEQSSHSKYWCTQFWNWESQVRERILKGFWADRIAISADGGLAAISNVKPYALYLYSIATGQRLVTFESDTKRYIDLLRFAPDGRVLAVVYKGSTVVQLFDCDTGKHIRQMPTAHTEKIRTLDFRADGKLLATSSYGKAEVKIWDWQNDLVLYDLLDTGITQDEPGVATARFSPDGRRLVTSHSGGNIRIWTDFEKRECRVVTGNVLGDNPFDVFFTGDGRHIVCVYRAGTIQVLRLAEYP